MSRVLAARRSSPQTVCSWVRMERQSPLMLVMTGNVVPCKSTSDGYVGRALAHNLLPTGHQTVILQNDQEPSIIDANHKAGTHIQTEIVYEESPVGDSNANGSIERANQAIQGKIRAIKDYTERQIGATIGLDSSVLNWLVRHAALTLATFQV